ncbi:TonB-dependent receptor [Sphingomonas quercus]|nr:TonB-dependent receptor [Sphingomonas quercus]
MGASSLAALTLGAPATAQSQPAGGPQDEIVVTGIRGSLQRNLDAKREASGVVDVISAEDIGKFPDSNVAASLQRLPGVSIQRNGARGEPTGITVRGFGGDFNTTLVDGRRISTATGNRSVDFSTVGSDFVGGLSVYKTPDVSLSSSSIGATLNIQYAKPFDRPGLRIAASGSGSIQDGAGHVVPAGGLLISDTFADDTFGILVDAMYTRHDTQSNRVYVAGWIAQNFAPCQISKSADPNCAAPGALAAANRNIVGWFPQQYGAYQNNVRDTRYDGRLALQWQPADSLLITLDDNFTRQRINNDNYGFGVWFNQANLRNVQLDENGAMLDFTQPGVSQTDLDATNGGDITQMNQVGLNVKWEATDNLTVEADGSWAKSLTNPGNKKGGTASGDVGYGFKLMDPNFGLRVGGDSSDSIPELHNYGIGGDPTRWAPTDFMGSHVAGRARNKNTDDVKQVRLSAEWKQDDVTIKFGGDYLKDRYTMTPWGFGTSNFSQAYAGYGPFGQLYQTTGQLAGVAMSPSLFTGTVNLGKNFIPGYSGSLPPDVLVYSGYAYLAALEALGNPQATNIPGFSYGGVPTYRGQFSLSVNPAALRDIREKTWSLFLRAKFDTEIAGRPFHFNAGVRNEHTNLSSSGFSLLPVSMRVNPGDPTLMTVTLSAASPITTKNDYGYLLPAVDMKLELTDRLHLRFDASRTLTRPALNVLNPVLSVPTGPRTGALSASGGNPLLKPYLADNFDLAAEWYYRANSYLSVNFFVKNVSNFVVGGTSRQTINTPSGTPVIDPTTGQPAVFTVTQQVNGPDATVRGVEIALQHVFGNSGFGLTANATLVNTNKPYDKFDRTTTGFAVTGLANSANFVGFFDKYGFEARVALNYRGEYLLQFGQPQASGTLFGSEPIFVNPSMQIDFSTSYDVTKQLTVFFEALNLNNETYSTHGRFDNQLLEVFRYGRRFTAGARFHF